MKRVAVLVCLLACGALAQETDLSSVSSLKVDLDAVVELGVVSPVDGLTTAGQPDEAALEVFADAGYLAVIDVRGEAEDRGFDQQAVVEELGMYYVQLPIEDKSAISFENAKKLDELIGEHDGPVLVHCRSANRVGALIALRASLDGADDETAIEIGKEAGLTRLEGVVREALENGEE